MPNFNIYIFTKAGNKTRYTVDVDDQRSVMKAYDYCKVNGLTKLTVECSVTGVLAMIPIDNIDFIQCQKIKEQKP